jgi:catechol 2,3-dioxygenase-like lactoylglutathione lyase family enzyme
MKFNTLIPEFSVTDLNRTLDFYTKILGFTIEYRRDDSHFAFLSWNAGQQIMIEQINGNWQTGEMEYPFGRGINFQFEVQSVNELLDVLKKYDYPVFIEPEENWYRVNNKEWGSLEFLIKDPDGYLLRFSEDLGFREIKETVA